MRDLIEQRSYNALAIEHFGSYQTLAKLLHTHGSWTVAHINTRTRQSPDPERAWRALERRQIKLLLAKDADFPPLLREIPWPPHAIYLRGALIGSEPKVAMVGTRKATPLGLSTAANFARDLSRAGVTIVSGLAFGIDVAAHRATLEAGGRAVAVLASGLDTITPLTNAHVGEQIIKRGGSIISEYPPGTPARPNYFIERNRLVSGLSRGVVIIEAPIPSGTLSTARFAIEQNREVFVVPGAVNNQNYAGSHELIKSGAALVTAAQDVLDALDLLPKKNGAKRATLRLPFLDEQQQRVVEVLAAAAAPLSADAISERSSLGAAAVSEALGLLTIEGVVKEQGGRYYM